MSCRRGAELGQRRGQRGPPRASSVDPDPTEIGFPPAARNAPSSREDRYASDRGRISQAGRERGSAERLDSTTRVCGESRGDSVHVDHGNLTRYVRPFANPAPQITHGDPGGDTILFPDPVPPEITDFAPYWRPPGYAKVMILADGIAWEGGVPETLSLVAERADIGRLPMRAVGDRACTPDEP